MLLLASDFDVNGIALRGLRRRVPNIDLLRAQDFLPEGTPDPEVLEWAAGLNRVLITNDRQTMAGFAFARLAAGQRMPGLILTTNDQSLGDTIDHLQLMEEYMTADDMCSQVIFLPLS